MLETSPAPADDPVLDDGPLAALLRELPEKHRIALALFYVEELSIRNIAEALSLPVGTVKSRLHYARNNLKEVIERRDQ